MYPALSESGSGTDSRRESATLSVRHDLRPADLDAVLRLHVRVYCHQLGFDASFAEHVETPLREWAERRTERDRIWLVERAGELVGCVAVVDAGEAAQLRWFVLTESERGQGVGRRLLGEAVAFARTAGYRSLFLWTVNTLTAAARAYTAAGFTLTEEVPGGWAEGMTEQRYEMRFDEPEAYATDPLTFTARRRSCRRW